MKNILAQFKNYFSILKVKNLQYYLSSQALWQIAIWTLGNVYSLLVFNLSGQSAQSLGYVNLATGAGVIISSLTMNSIPDKYNKISIIKTLQKIQILGASFIAFMLFSGIMEVINSTYYAPAISLATITIYMMNFLGGIIFTLYFLSNQMFLKEMAGNDQFKKAIGINSIIVNINRFLGPALAAIFISLFDYGFAFVFVVVIFCPMSYFLGKISIKDEKEKQTISKKATLLEVFKCIIEDYRSLGLFLINVFFAFFAFPIFMFAPAIAEGNPADTGLLLSSSGLASLLCITFVIPVLNTYPKTGKMVSYAMIWVFAWLVMLSVNQNIIWEMICFFFAGLGNTIIMITSLGSIQIITPAKYQAKILSVFNITLFALQPIATTIIGYFADAFGLTFIINITAMLGLIGSYIMLVKFKTWRKWDETKTIIQPQVTSTF